MEQVRRSVNTYLTYHQFPPTLRDEEFNKELSSQHGYQTRRAQAKKSHTKTRIAFYKTLGIDVDKIKSCIIDLDSHKTYDLPSKNAKVALSN